MVKILELFDDVKIKVHSDGRVETFDHNRIRSNGTVDSRKGRVLKPGLDTYGYLKVVLTRNGVRKSYSVHRLVALAYIPNNENKPTVNHINGVKTDNRVENLEWATHSEQKKHSIENGLCKANTEALDSANKRRSIPILFNDIKYPSIRRASRETGLSRSEIKREGCVVNE